MSQQRASDAEFGPQEDFHSLGLETCSHTYPTFTVERNEGCEIKFKSSKPVKFTTKLINAEKESEDLSSYVLSQRYENFLHFIINFPESGSYKFQLFALPAEAIENSLPNVYNYLIQVKNANKAVYSFPKQYAQWKDGCTLEEPRVLNSHCSLKAVLFKINIPNAKSAAVVINGKEWNHLKKKDPCCFTGTLDLHKLRDSGAKVTVNANYDEGSGSYSTLLEYRI